MSISETENCEYKQSLAEWKEVVESIAAFATSRGGCVNIGVAPDGARTGIDIGKGTLEDLANKIKQNTEPPQFPSIEVEDDGTDVIVKVSITESPLKPVSAFGRALKRVGRTNQRLNRQETQRLVEITTGRTWDAFCCEGFGLDGIDTEALISFLRMADQNALTDSRTVIENLGLLSSDGIANGAVLLFGRNPQRFFPDAQVKCARFKGNIAVDFIDERTFDGTILNQLPEALKFVERNTRQAIKITGKATRDIVAEYPPEAIREAITNAICHRDYAKAGAVQVRIYDNRLEIWNPGELSSDLTIDDLYREHPSRPRNRKLAAALHRAKLMEQWGTGTRRIVALCEQAKLPPPEFISEMGTFVVRFERLVRKPVPVKPNDRQNRVIEHIHQHGHITTKEYGDLFGLAKRQSARDLHELEASGLLVRQGKARQTRYVLGQE